MTERDELVAFLSEQAFLLPNFNDTFAYACADTEKVYVGDGEVFARFWRAYGWHGLVAIAAWTRRKLPLEKYASHPKFQAALSELRLDPVVEEEDGHAWTLREEFELTGEGPP